MEEACNTSWKIQITSTCVPVGASWRTQKVWKFEPQNFMLMENLKLEKMCSTGNFPPYINLYLFKIWILLCLNLYTTVIALFIHLHPFFSGLCVHYSVWSVLLRYLRYTIVRQIPAIKKFFPQWALLPKMKHAKYFVQQIFLTIEKFSLCSCDKN